MSPSTLTTLTALAVVSFLSTTAFASLGHHAHPGLTSLSHLPAVVGTLSADGDILTTEEDLKKRALEARYYGDSRGFSRPKTLGNQKREIPSGWTAVGCVAEGTSSRTLDGFSYIDSAMTTESCLATCLTKGFAYGGMEWSDECYCGSSFTGGGGAAVSYSACSMPCAGSTSETCGGNYVLTAYQYSNTGGSCATATTSASLIATSTAAASGSAASKSASATITSSAAVASASATGSSGSTTTEWETLGCFYDNPAVNNNLHILTGTSITGQTNMTPALCQTRCAGQGYNFAGLEYGSECWCGDLTTSEISSLTSNAPWCNMACTGDSSQSCGGGWSLEVYEQVDVSDDC